MTQSAVPKIEGHAAFYAHLRNGRVDEARMIGLESDRFVEKILLGRKYFEAPIITSRICGICPTIHNTTSIEAIEAACGIVPTSQTVLLRKLMLAGQMIQSHSLHLYLLVLPDFVGASSSFELQKSHPDLFKNAILLKQYADALLDEIGGRAVHPIADVPGGFKHFPEMSELKNLLKLANEIAPVAKETIKLFSTFRYPEMKREIIYSALHETDEYAVLSGKILNSEGDSFLAKSYTEYIYEELKPYTRSKFGTLRGKEMMVGSMARMNLSRHLMESKIFEIIEELKLPKNFDNPFDNIMAQALENYHFVLQSMKLIEHFIKEGVDKKEPVKPPKKFGKGTSACEAPRGTLFHYYELDKDGNIIDCDIITPTVQNLPALEFDMKNLAPIIKDMKKSDRDKTIEMLIRAYDPCITCATH